MLQHIRKSVLGFVLRLHVTNPHNNSESRAMLSPGTWSFAGFKETWSLKHQKLCLRDRICVQL